MKRLICMLSLALIMAVPTIARICWPIPNRHVVITDSSIKYRAYDHDRKKSVRLHLSIDRENDRITKFDFSVGGINYYFPKCVRDLFLSARLSSISISSWYFRDDDYEIAFEASPQPEDGRDAIRKSIVVHVEGGTYVAHSIYLTMKDCTIKDDTTRCAP